MKDARWIDDKKCFNATIIYSTDNQTNPVRPDFVDRVHLTSSSYSVSTGKQNSVCSISICNLKKTDSGKYSVRYIGNEYKWHSEEVVLSVEGKYTSDHYHKERGNVILYCNSGLNALLTKQRKEK